MSPQIPIERGIHGRTSIYQRSDINRLGPDSVFGQFVSFFFFLAMVVPLSNLTYVFLSPEMFALYFLGISAVISITFFISNAPIAAAFELVVCAGLITVLFISTISLTRGGGEE